MSKEIFLKSNDLRLLYFRYKDSSYYTLFIIALVFFVCMLLFFQLIIPQVQNWFSIRNEVIATQARIDVINQNITFMSTIDKPLLENQVKITTSALPFEKDFGGILNALTDASVQAGISLDDYSFQVGNIASISGQQSNLAKDLSSVKLKISVTGDINGINKFLKEINTKLPLSEVIDVDGEFSSTTVTLQFYQKQFPKIVFRDDKPLVMLPNKYNALLTELEAWMPVVTSQEQQETASESAVPLF